MAELSQPKNLQYYNPQEKPKRYPLELTESLHICLWAQGGETKWTIALFDDDEEGPELRFIGDRPLNERVDWKHFGQLVRQGYEIAMRRFRGEWKVGGLNNPSVEDCVHTSFEEAVDHAKSLSLSTSEVYGIWKLGEKNGAIALFSEGVHFERKD